MLTCKDVAQLVSKSMDAPLSFVDRLRLLPHLYLGRMCRNCIRQMKNLRHFLRQQPNRPGPDLSAAARDRMKSTLRSRRPPPND